MENIYSDKFGADGLSGITYLLNFAADELYPK